MIEQFYVEAYMDYILSEPIPLPVDLVEKEKVLLPYAQRIAKWYGDSFDPFNPQRQLTTALHSSYVIEATNGDELMGFFGYGKMSPENPQDKPFYENLDLDKLPENLLPAHLDEVSRTKVKDAIQTVKNDFNKLEILEQVADQSMRQNGFSTKAKEIAFADIPPRRRVILGDIATGSSIIQRTKPEVGGVTFYGGQILEPNRKIPLGLTADEFKVLSMVIAHAYVAKHYPGVEMDRNGILDSEVWDKQTVMPDFRFATSNPDPSKNNLAVPQIKLALQKMIDYQEQNPGHFYSGIAVTIVDDLF